MLLSEESVHLMRLKCINWFTLLHQPSMPEDPLECRIINLYGFGAAVEFCCCCCCWHSFILSLCYGLQFLRFETLRSFCAFPVLKRPTKSVIYMWGYMQMIKERHQHSLNAKNDKCNKKKGHDSSVTFIRCKFEQISNSRRTLIQHLTQVNMINAC